MLLHAVFAMLKGIFEYTKLFSCSVGRVINFYWNCQKYFIRLPVVEIICIVLTANKLVVSYPYLFEIVHNYLDPTTVRYIVHVLAPARVQLCSGFACVCHFGFELGIFTSAYWHNLITALVNVCIDICRRSTDGSVIS